jgi:hypothetical protein
MGHVMNDEPSMQSLGGKARAEKLTPKQLTSIAKGAAAARWKVPKATHYGELHIGELPIRCAVLDSGTRVLTQYDFLRAIGRSGKPAAGRGSADLIQFERVSPLLDSENLKPFIPPDLYGSIQPIEFRVPGGSKAWGYPAELLPSICDVYLRARESGALRKNQYKFAAACEVLVRALAHVGIIALVDEATGYQYDRARDALAKILEKFIAKELQPWTRTFPLEFYKEMFRLKGWSFDADTMQGPRVIGRYTDDIVYKRLAPFVRDELRKKNPVVDGRRKHKHFQWLTGEIGHPKLLAHLEGVKIIMRESATWEEFKTKMDRHYPITEQSELGFEVQVSKKPKPTF